jgi:hypothetical protein
VNATQLAKGAELILKQFGEQVTYVPAHGAERIILAVVDRNPPADIAETPQGTMADAITVEVANRLTAVAQDGVGGIGAVELDTGRDAVMVSRRLGGMASKQRIARILSQDAGMMRLEVQ